MLRYFNLLHIRAKPQAVSLVNGSTFSLPQKCPLFGYTSALATLSQFATYQSETASGLACESLYIFSTAEVSPIWVHLCSLLRFLNLSRTRATPQAVSLVNASTFSPSQKCPLFGNTSAHCYVFSTCHVPERNRKRYRL